MTDLLKEIVERKRREIEQLKVELPLPQLESMTPKLPRIDFAAALKAKQPVKIIAELKKASPSRGVLVDDFRPDRLARQYHDGGACALSVLTERHYFLGDPEYLVMAKKESGLPVLWKDFIVDQYQLFYAAHMGADAILLIARLHSAKSLSRLLTVANEIGLDCLIETHKTDEVSLALGAGAKIVGVNNRDLKDFTVSLERCRDLAAHIPDTIVKVAESGIFTSKDVTRMKSWGFDCFLIGEALVKADDPIALLQELTSA